MDEIKELKEQIKFLEEKYKELVEEIVKSECQCGKAMPIHFHMNEESLKEHFLNKIK
jgi:hypothetical protein